MKSSITAGMLVFFLLSNAQATTVVSTLETPTLANFTGLGTNTNASRAFGQIFTVSTADTKLTSFSFDLSPVTGSLNAVFDLYAWNGSDKVGAAIYQSPVTTFSGGVQRATFSPNVTLNQGNTYIAFLDVANLGNSILSHSGFVTVLDNSYSGGSFVYKNDSIYQYRGPWINSGRDSKFSATFTNPVPEPETYAMLIAGLGFIGAIARRRKQDRA